MSLYLGILLFSFIFTSLATIPFIDLLFYLKFTYKRLSQSQKPVGGGILIIIIVSFLFLILFSFITRFGVFIQTSFPLRNELNILFLTFISFGVIGLYADLLKISGDKIHSIVKYVIPSLGSLVIAFMLYRNLNLDYFSLPFLGVIHLGIGYIPIAAGVILLFIKGFNVVDSVDGAVGGNLLISLIALWLLSVKQLDTPLSLFISLLCGALLALLYFNVYPARILLGRAGTLAFGSIFAVIGLILGKPTALVGIGLIFAFSGFLSLLGRDPFVWIFHRGWASPKIMMRSWLLTFIFSVLALSLS